MHSSAILFCIEILICRYLLIALFMFCCYPTVNYSLLTTCSVRFSFISLFRITQMLTEFILFFYLILTHYVNVFSLQIVPTIFQNIRIYTLGMSVYVNFKLRRECIYLVLRLIPTEIVLVKFVPAKPLVCIRV